MEEGTIAIKHSDKSGKALGEAAITVISSGEIDFSFKDAKKGTFTLRCSTFGDENDRCDATVNGEEPEDSAQVPHLFNKLSGVISAARKELKQCNKLALSGSGDAVCSILREGDSVMNWLDCALMGVTTGASCGGAYASGGSCFSCNVGCGTGIIGTANCVGQNAGWW